MHQNGLTEQSYTYDQSRRMVPWLPRGKDFGHSKERPSCVQLCWVDHFKLQELIFVAHSGFTTLHCLRGSVRLPRGKGSKFWSGQVVSDLTTKTFIGALKSFVSRRGNCCHLYCDNATNFAARPEFEESPFLNLITDNLRESQEYNGCS